MKAGSIKFSVPLQARLSLHQTPNKEIYKDILKKITSSLNLLYPHVLSTLHHLINPTTFSQKHQHHSNQYDNKYDRNLFMFINHQFKYYHVCVSFGSLTSFSQHDLNCLALQFPPLQKFSRIQLL
jgi:hypothetical protein